MPSIPLMMIMHATCTSTNNPISSLSRHSCINSLQDAQCITTNKASVTMVFDELPNTWNMVAIPFIEQLDGQNCGAIACLKFMDLFKFMTPDKITNDSQTYREIVFHQYEQCLSELDDELLVRERVKKEDIKALGMDNICVCKVINLVERW